MSDVQQRLTTALGQAYRVDRELGAGGMATVYLAHDLRHERDVAIKVLHPDLGAALGADRFLAEIKTTAKLQHPHILPLLDSGAADGLLYYVMPFVRGETLRARLERERQLPLEDAQGIAAEVADALAYAHQQGIVHRDIKPENILLQDGHALVADFGIALAVQEAGGQRMTQTGLSLGTPQYMSPEQAAGERGLDHRTDIYAIGAVTYEMLAGEPPFSGPSVPAIVSRILSEEPRGLIAQRNTIGDGLEYAVLRALAKLPADRWASAGEFRRALLAPTATTARTITPVNTEGHARGAAIRRSLLVGGLVIASSALTAWFVTQPKPADVKGTARFTLEFPDGYREARNGRFEGASYAISPDGRTIVATLTPSSKGGDGHLYRRRIDQLEWTSVRDSVEAGTPTFSPDGRWVAFVSPALELFKISIDGGPVVRLASKLDVGTMVEWGADDSLTFVSGNRQLMRVAANGGGTVRVPVDSTRAWGNPFVLPDGRTLLARRCAPQPGCPQSDVVSIDLRKGTVQTVVANALWGRVLANDLLLYGTAEGSFVVRFDAGALRTEGSSVPVDLGRQSLILRTPLAVGADGSALAMRSIESRAGSQIIAVRRDGGERVLFEDRGELAMPRLKPDGRQLLASLGGKLKLYDIASKALVPVLPDVVSHRFDWAPDGRQIIYSSADGLYLAPIDGSRTPVRAIESGPEALNVTMPSWSSNGSWVLFDGIAKGTEQRRERLFALSMGTPRRSEELLSASVDLQSAVLSPDGSWVAYVSSESDAARVYVSPFRRAGARIPVSIGAGLSPQWISDRELAYLDYSTRRLVIAEIQPGDPVQIVKRTPLFSVQSYRISGTSAMSFDVNRDGSEFYFAKTLDGLGASRLVLTLNWAAELRKQLEKGVAP